MATVTGRNLQQNQIQIQRGKGDNKKRGEKRERERENCLCLHSCDHRCNAGKDKERKSSIDLRPFSYRKCLTEFSHEWAADEWAVMKL